MTKILFFIDTTLASGGAEKALRELVNHMDPEKFEITVHTVWTENPADYLIPSVRYRAIFQKKNRFNRLLFRLETALGLTYRLHVKDDYDIEVAYLECAPTKILASSNNKKALKLAWVHCDLSKITEDTAKFVSQCKKWYKKFDKVVCVSKTVQDSYIQLFGHQTKSCVMHNTINDEQIKEKAADMQTVTGYRNKTIFLTVGRMYPQKGYDRLLEAHRQLRQQGYDYDLWILGDGTERKKLERFVHRHKLEDSVFMPGFQKNPYPYMRDADVVVCSSYYEGFSTVVTEALILGKCVVTTACSGMDELLGENRYGLITENSVEGIRNGMQQLLDDPQRIADYAAAAAERGKAFSKDALLNATQDFFAQELAKKRSQ